MSKIEAILITKTHVAGVKKLRWECPICRKNKAPECRFNLTAKTKDIIHKCRFCKNELIIKYKGD